MVPAAAPDTLPARPSSVTIIGGALLALSSLRFLLDCLGWIVWTIGDAERVVRFFLPKDTSGFVPIDWIVRHFTAVVACQAAAAVGVAFVSYNFLRLRPWARPALEAVCWVALAGTLAMQCAFGLALAHLAPGVDANGLAASLASMLAVDVLLVAVIWTIRRPRVRQAFATRQALVVFERGDP